ncbi:DUF6134 family protein [Magnetospirillum sulfuroxidans]|uniref:Uncharacterized protein n=1 Tax=Magnetospirillum sulfuroxidans TaxID=611300 RepID=A0ABS5IHG4_9PROT|nr:DUF6134 family protein [Magnetospirillum sulfuroxidans]MBR9973830.1 hypothetical protein [Magnetospirillum sulfuroxidans]
MRPVAVFAAAVVICLASAAQAEPRVLRYEIRKDGEAIGAEVVRIAKEGESTVVEVENHTRTTVLFMDFVFDQTRREEWQGATLRRMIVDTNDDGTRSRLEAGRSEAEWTVTVNGTTERRPAASLPLVLWTAKVVEAPSFFGTIDAAPYRVQVARLGEETLFVAGGSVAATHYRLSGDIDRDLWYGADGTLVKTTFKRKGFPIEFVRVAP